jgi:chromosome partitioning protein
MTNRFICFVFVIIHAMKRIIVHNRKGGTGKSVIATHLAYALERHGRVLLIDLDQQGNTTDVVSRQRVSFAASALFEKQLRTSQASEPDSRFKLCASDRASLTSVLDNKISLPETIGNYLLNLDYLAEFFDYAVIDTSPGNTVIERAALAGSSHVVIPVEPTEFSINGAKEVAQFCAHISKDGDNPIEQLSVVLNRVSSSSKRQQEKVAGIIMLFGEALVQPLLRERDIYKVSHELGIPIWEMKSNNGTTKSAVADMVAVINQILTPYNAKVNLDGGV